VLDLSGSSADFDFNAGNGRRVDSQTTASAASTITRTTDSGAETSGEWSVSQE
jgi:hypothetical protein